MTAGSLLYYNKVWIGKGLYMKRLILWICTMFALTFAVSAATFTDFEQVDYPSAVIMLTDLGVLSGYEDGTFRPNNTMSRSEIAKVMAVLSTDTMSTSDGLSFLDTQNSWAKDYIEYCAQEGIISGSDGYFRPEDNLTVRELCKMLLVIIGEKEELFTGAIWAENVEEYANSYGLLAGFVGELDRYVTREGAALLINNALQCDIILDFDENNQPIYNLDEMRNPKSLLETRFGAVLVQGVVEANSVHDLRTSPKSTADGCIHISGYTKDFLVSDMIASDHSILGHKITIYAIFGTDYNRIVGTVDAFSGENSIYLDNMDAVQLLYDKGLVGTSNNTRYFMDFIEIKAYQLEYFLTFTTAVTMIDHDDDGSLEYFFMTAEPKESVEEPALEEGTSTEEIIDEEA